MSLPGQSGGDATRRRPNAVTTSVISPDLTATVKLGVATGVASWQWYTARQTGNPPEQGPARIVLICSGISSAILLFQFFVVPSMLASSTGVAFLSSAISSAFSYGFWLMVLGAAGAVFGAVRQLRL